MGKKEKYSMDVRLDELKRKRESIQEQIDAMNMGCRHRNSNGKARLKDIDRTRGHVRCKDCGTEFCIFPISEDELKRTIYNMHNIINQIIFMSSMDEDHQDIVKLGQIDKNIMKKIGNLYTGLVLKIGKKKKKDKKKKEYRKYVSTSGMFS